MLIFIKSSYCGAPLPPHSNTSHVNLYLRCRKRQSQAFRHSNTSHVNLYRIFLLFSVRQIQNSNTSHVNLYLINHLLLPVYRFIQIHLMLIFIRFLSPVRPLPSHIQIHLMLIFILSPVVSHLLPY